MVPLGVRYRTIKAAAGLSHLFSSLSERLLQGSPDLDFPSLPEFPHRRIPVDRRTARSPLASAPAHDRRRSPGTATDARALVVEDDPDLNEAICFLLESDGFLPVGVFNGAEALAFLAETPGPLPSVILADLAMPVMNGWELRARLEADARVSRIPLLVLSTFVDDNVDVSGHRPELQLAKPFGAEMLLLCVNRLVGARPGSGRARIFENLVCRLSKNQSAVTFLLDEHDKLPLFSLPVRRFEVRIVREVASGCVRATLGAPEVGGLRRLVLSRTWGGAELLSRSEAIRIDGDA